MTERIILYLCDPSKNVDCRGAGSEYCKVECRNTAKKECAILDDNSKPIVVFDSENPPPIERRTQR